MKNTDRNNQGDNRVSNPNQGENRVGNPNQGDTVRREGQSGSEQRPKQGSDGTIRRDDQASTRQSGSSNQNS